MSILNDDARYSLSVDGTFFLDGVCLCCLFIPINMKYRMEFGRNEKNGKFYQYVFVSSAEQIEVEKKNALHVLTSSGMNKCE